MLPVGRNASVDSDELASIVDLESQVVVQGGSSDTMSMSHFRNVSDDAGSVGRHTDMTDIDVSLKDSHSYLHSSFYKLDGSIDSILVMNILVYLNAKELIALGSTNRYFARVSLAPTLWNLLYRRDFTLEEPIDSSDSVSLISIRPTLHSVVTHQSAGIPAYSKAMYARRYCEYNERITRSIEETLHVQNEARHSARVHTIETILDLTQVRLILPLSIGCVFLTIILLCQRIDGLDISYWMCFIPILVALLYAVLSFHVLQVVHKHQYSGTHILRGLWANFRSPLVFIYQELLGSHMSAVYGSIALLVLCMLQVMLVATKLSPSTPQDMRDHYLPWGVVFIPIWIFFALYCALPLAFRSIDPGAFVASILFFFIPMFVFFVCLTVKLTGEQHRTGHRRIRLALMLIPFWILEGLVLLGSLMFLISGIHRYRRGLDTIREYVTVFGVCWVCVAPLVVFQALLSARDDYQQGMYGSSQRHSHMQPTATEVVTPILVLIGWIWISVTVVSMYMKTAFQEARERVFHDAAGLRIMYQF